MATRKKTATKTKASKKATTRKRTATKKKPARATKRTAKITPVAAEPVLESTACWTRGAPQADAPQAEIQAPRPVEAPKPVLGIAPREAGWIEVSYEGDGMFCHPEAGVFVRGTRTRLRASLADQLRGAEGVRLAA